MHLLPSGGTHRVLAAVVTALALAVSATACTDDDAAAPSASGSPSDSASTADTTSLEKSNAELEVKIAQVKGIARSHRAHLARQIGKPIGAWLDAAYLTGEFPRGHYTTKDFPGWTADAAALARRDASVTTSAAVSKHAVSVVADKRSAQLYVFSLHGLTGGATARLLMRLTTQDKAGHRTRFLVGGDVYLTRKDSDWRIFGYDLHRTVLR